VSALPSVRRLAAIGAAPAPSPHNGEPVEELAEQPLIPRVDELDSALGGDDDEDTDLDDLAIADTEVGEEDFYADVMDSR
jgi:hypothetical protein